MTVPHHPLAPVRRFLVLESLQEGRYLGLDRDTAGGVTLKPVPVGAGADGFAGLRLRMAGGEGSAFFRLYSLAADGSELLLYRTPVQRIRAHPSRLEDAALEASGGFVGNGSSWAYADGSLGPTLAKGGDGTAERRYLEGRLREVS